MFQYNLEPWELLLKYMIWDQLSFIHGSKVLDFGSGRGITADFFAKDNNLVAIEPNQNMLNKRIANNSYQQIIGSIDELKKLKDNSFDVVLCHNVLEYVEERNTVVREFERILKKNGTLSIVKHNPNGRIMQMVVLLNNFEHANELLDGKSGRSAEFGTIKYYQDNDILKWSASLKIEEIYGLRTFWDLQQNQEIQKNSDWQKKMLAIENKVSRINEFKAIAFFHHIILRKI